LFDNLENNWEVDSHPVDFAEPVNGDLCASLTDAAFAADGLLLQCEV
jgi:hypothetical protein